MVRRLNSIVRLFTLVVAALQIALPPAVSIADGLLSRTSQRTEVRPSGFANTVKSQAHPVDCLLCWYLNATLAQPGAQQAAAVLPDAAHALDTQATLSVRPARPGHYSRAPPELFD